MKINVDKNKSVRRRRGAAHARYSLHAGQWRRKRTAPAARMRLFTKIITNYVWYIKLITLIIFGATHTATARLRI